ncbi:MAG: hypothetical protein FWG70_06700 [Oscillospiraceae bacterium]|nr:hypothetical protein [Oscillospiraceae bacterium]
MARCGFAGTPWAASPTIYGAMSRSVERVCLAQCAITPQLADVSCFFGVMWTSRPTKRV